MSSPGSEGQNETALDLLRAAGDCGVRGIHHRRRRDRAVPVELAPASALRLAPADVLAGAWAAGAVPDPLRRLRQTLRPALQTPAPPGGALGAHVAGGAGAP